MKTYKFHAIRYVIGRGTLLTVKNDADFVEPEIGETIKVNNTEYKVFEVIKAEPLFGTCLIGFFVKDSHG